MSERTSAEPSTEYDAALDAAVRHARDWLRSVQTRPVAARTSIEAIVKELSKDHGGDLPPGRRRPTR